MERGVKKQARQTNAVPADLNLRIVFSVFTGLNYNASFTSFDSKGWSSVSMILHIVELLIFAMMGEKFIMGAVFDNSSVIYDDDPIGVLDSR